MSSEETSDPVLLDHTQEARSLADTHLRKFFEVAAKYEASDLLLRGGQVPKLRLSGELKPLETDPLDIGKFEEAVEQSLSETQWRYYSQHGSIDMGLDLSDKTRFRINIFRTRGRSAVAARLISATILKYEQLHLPKVMGEVAEQRQGLVLVCGVTGSGKSTTIASMLQQVNETRACHIVTIEDPIEYLFSDSKAIVNQREIGIDVPDFATGLRALVRENPDVVLIGEMRDRETFEAALRAAETGHLVFGTIHASSAIQAFGRIYDLFPATERPTIRNLLAYQMRAFICQRLLPTLHDDIQRVHAVEVLLQSPPTRKYILEEREHELHEVIKSERESGMQSFTDSLVDLVQKEFIHPRVAQTASGSPQEIKMRLRGIKSQ